MLSTKLPANLRTTLLRPEDMLYIDFEFINLVLKTGDGQNPRLVRKEQDQPAYIVAHFQPQNIAEKAFFEGDDNFEVPDEGDPDAGNKGQSTSEALEPPPIDARIAGPSRLVFSVPSEITEIPYTAENLLDWAKYEQSVAPTALPPNPTEEELTPIPIIAKPQLQHTSIELPYRLILSPNRTAGWAHSIQPVTHGGRTELWHTRLGVRQGGKVDENISDTRTIRAIWSPDYNAANPKDPPDSTFFGPFRMSLTPNDRHQIVRLSADFTISETLFHPGGGRLLIPYNPLPIQVDRFMLTSLGAWMNVHGAWELSQTLQQQEKLTIEDWRHIASMGRDHYVRVVYAGYLYPFGHRASLIKITERKFQSTPDGNVAAYLRQRMYIMVREPEKQYTGAAYANQGREMPLSESIRITTLVTPNLDDPTEAPSSILGMNAFWIRVNNSDFKFHLIAEDVELQHAEFTTALIFISADIINDDIQMGTIEQAYTTDDTRRRCDVPGQKVAFAARNTTKLGDTSLTTESLYFDTDTLTTPGPNGLTFLPILDKADVRIPAVEHLVGTQEAKSIQLFKLYIEHGFDETNNQAQVFAKLTDNLGLSFPADKAGGLATPNMDISGLSQHLGPVAGSLENLAAGTFNPTDFFSADAMLLGGISLSSIIQSIFDEAQFPKMLSQPVPPTGVPTSIVTTLNWSPKIKKVEPFEPGSSSNFEINAKLEAKLDGSESTFRITGTLTDFAINFLDVIKIQFDSLTFTAEKNKKLDVSAKVADQDGVQFAGPLAFVKEIQKFIPPTGFSDPPSLDVSPTGVTVGYTLALPPLAVGVFALQNVSLSAGLSLPFTADKARLRFAFSERHHPFLLSVSMFGGGGFFGLAIGLDGIELIEAALEFGGTVSIDLGVASGGVYVMAGIYFNLKAPNNVELAGYLRCGGSLEVLGLVCVSVEFYMELAYVNGKVRGQATLTVEVETVVFSKSIDLTVERSFGGSSGDPKFADLIAYEDWKAYGEAFA